MSRDDWRGIEPLAPWERELLHSHDTYDDKPPTPKLDALLNSPPFFDDETGTCTLVVTHIDGEMTTYPNVFIPGQGEMVTVKGDTIKFEGPSPEYICYTVLGVRSFYSV